MAAAELQRINLGYLALAKAMIKQHQYDAAEENLKNVQTASPGFPGLADLQLDLNTARGVFERQKAAELVTRSEVNQRLESARAAIKTGALVRPEFV